jgi:hypothetical protein
MTEEKRHKSHLILTTISTISAVLTIVVLGMTLYKNSSDTNQRKGIDQQRLLELEKGREENKQGIVKINETQQAVITAVEGLKGEVKNSNTKIDLMSKQLEKLDNKLETHVNATLAAKPKSTG